MKNYFINNYMYNYIQKADSYTLGKCEIMHIDAFLFKSTYKTVYSAKEKVEMTTREGLVQSDGVHGVILKVPTDVNEDILGLFEFATLLLEEVTISIPTDNQDIKCIAILI